MDANLNITQGYEFSVVIPTENAESFIPDGFKAYIKRRFSDESPLIELNVAADESSITASLEADETISLPVCQAIAEIQGVLSDKTVLIYQSYVNINPTVIK